jgi:hypothetical protein
MPEEGKGTGKKPKSQRSALGFGFSK